MKTAAKVPDDNARLVNGSLPSDAFADLRAAPPRAATTPSARGLVMIDGGELARPLPSVVALVESLGIVPGFPTCFAGYGYSRKTLAAQAFALSIASGEPLWGMHYVPQGRAVHLDYEQGKHLTTERYQRLARGMGIDLAALGGTLRVCNLPDVYLTERDASDVIARAVDGASLVIVDSLRAATRGSDENSSNIREPIDMLGRVSEKTGAAFLMIHHARKPMMNARGGKFSLRGSSALFDAFSSVFVFSSEKDEPTMVTHEKSRADGRTRDDFTLDTEDVDVDGDALGGLRVVQLNGRVQPTPFDELKERVVAALKCEPGLKSKNAINARVKGTKAYVNVAIDELVEAGRIEQTDTGYILGANAGSSGSE